MLNIDSKSNAISLISIAILFLISSAAAADGVSVYKGDLTAEEGNNIAQDELGMSYFRERDYAKAIYWLKKSAAQGNANAMWSLGSMYDQGQGVKQDYIEAAKFYEQAAERGNPYAASNLGGMYASGRGVPKDDVKAYVWTHFAIYQYGRDDKMRANLTSEQLAQADRLIAEKRALMEQHDREYRKANYPAPHPPAGTTRPSPNTGSK